MSTATDGTRASLDDAGACTDFCSLPPEELQARAKLIRAELLPQVLRRERVEGGFVWEFSDSPGMKSTLEEFVEFERRCCAGMTFAITTDQSAERIRLQITGDGADTIAALADDAAAVQGEARPFRRLLKAGGLGVGASVFVCCLLPIGITAVAGAAVAAPLATLDQPLYIGIGGLLAGAAAWAYLGRRAAVCDDNC